jgi:RimJ/RimL family protein N-acetyltransferase
MTPRLVLEPEEYDGDVVQWRVLDAVSQGPIGKIHVNGRDGDALVIGYEIDNQWRDHGLATEALRAILERTTEPVIAETEIDHAASRRVMEKAGMHLDSVDGARVRYRFDVPSAP